MSSNRIISFTLGSMFLLAATIGVNAQPGVGYYHQAIQPGLDTTEIIQTHHKKKFLAHSRYYLMPYYCSWLKEKALHFRTSYWWEHYERCKNLNR